MTKATHSKAMDLSHLTVIELASVLAGPMAAMFFAELGATVHKIENPGTGGDMTRKWRLPQGDDGPVSAYYASINYGKTIHMLDLKSDHGRQQLYQLVSHADIVINNYNDSISAKLGVSYSDLKKIKTNLIYSQLYAYRPGDDRPGFDLVMQAETGFMMMNGHSDGPPAKMPVALIDVMAAHQLKEAILLALYHRSLTQKGSHCTVSLYESAIAALANQASNYLMAGHVPQRMGTRHPNIAPYGDIFKTADNQIIMLAIGSDKQWQKLGETLSFAADISNTFGTNGVRVKNRPALTAYLTRVIASYSYPKLHVQLTSNAIPFCKLMSIPDVFEQDQARSMILQQEDPNGQITKRVKTIAFDIVSARSI